MVHDSTRSSMLSVISMTLCGHYQAKALHSGMGEERGKDFMRASTLTLCPDITTNISRSSLADMFLTCIGKPPVVIILYPIKAVLFLSLELEGFFYN